MWLVIHTLIKGSNMIVCVLLVSNPRGCCLAAPGDHEGVIVAASIAVASTPGQVLVFCGRLGVWNRTAPDRRHLLPVATTKLIMRCVYKLNFRCTLSFPMKMTSSTQQHYPCFSRSVCFLMGSPAWWRFGLCSSRSSLVSRWRDAPLVQARISNVTLQM